MAIMSKATKKYVYSPLTAEQISDRVGVTRKDKALVTKVLTDLGYIGKKSVKVSPPSSAKVTKKSKQR
ncbi:MAG TPA: hypothetical protein VKK31_05575 [Thermoanaerobaculia bacterium]|nr:hypothetical protein [Thermoanaerobaculia bacterium]